MIGSVLCVCVCQNGTSCLGSVVISQGFWNERTRWPAVSLRTRPPLTHARTSLSCCTFSLCTVCVSPRLAPSLLFIICRKNVYVKLLFWHTGVGTATDRCFKHLVGFREGWLTVNIPLRHTRATQLLCFSWQRLWIQVLKECTRNFLWKENFPALNVIWEGLVTCFLRFGMLLGFSCYLARTAATSCGWLCNRRTQWPLGFIEVY